MGERHRLAGGLHEPDVDAEDVFDGEAGRKVISITREDHEWVGLWSRTFRFPSKAERWHQWKICRDCGNVPPQRTEQGDKGTEGCLPGYIFSDEK